MKLSKLVEELRGGRSLDRIELTYCSDAKKSLSSLLDVLQHHGVSSLHVATDFLMCLERDGAQKFLCNLSSVPRLDELTIESISRFHMPSIPPDALAPLLSRGKLKKLHLVNLYLTSANQSFLDGLGHALHNHTSLEQIILRNFIAKDSLTTVECNMDVLMDNIATISTLEVLNITGSFCFEEESHQSSLVSIPSLLRVLTMSSLKQLHLDLLGLQDCHFRAVASSIQTSKSSLTSLS